MHPRPLIAITGPRRGGIARFFIWIAVFLKGGRPKLFLESKKIKNKEFDGLIISGGDDLNHALYENEFCDLADIINSRRDALEYSLLHHAYSNKKPVLGICRGYQLINVYFGGTLYKDVTTDFGAIKYSILPWKKIMVKKGSVLEKACSTTRIKINTLHHQAVKKKGVNFRVMATDKDGMIQAIEDKTQTIFGVQWHPEYLIYQKRQLNIFGHLINLAKKSVRKA